MYPLYLNLNDGDTEMEFQCLAVTHETNTHTHTLMHANINVQLLVFVCKDKRKIKTKKTTNENIWYFRMNSWHFRQNGILKALDSLYLQDEKKNVRRWFSDESDFGCCCCCCGYCFEFFAGIEKWAFFHVAFLARHKMVSHRFFERKMPFHMLHFRPKCQKYFQKCNVTKRADIPFRSAFRKTLIRYRKKSIFILHLNTRTHTTHTSNA